MELVYLLLLLPSLPFTAAETVLGAYVFHRHGDRTTKSYSPTMLTALGADEVFASGTWFRANYIEDGAPSKIWDIASDTPVLSQLSITSPADNVLQSSAMVFAQGLYPPAGTASGQTLGNGTVVETPLGGFQYVPVGIVSSAASTSGSESSQWLQGSSGCGNAVVSSNDFFSSPEYLQILNSTESFYQSLLPVYNSTFSASKASFYNAYAIWDYILVSTIHNASSTIPADNLLTNETIFQLQTRADEHEWGLAYNSSSPIRAVAGAVLAGQIVQALNATLLAPPPQASAQRLTVQFGAYGTFMSFFGLAQLPAASPEFYGICNYASSMVLELVTNVTVSNATTAAVSPDDVSVRFLWANGTASDTNPPQPFPLFGLGQTLLPWNTFAAQMSQFAISSTAQWCTACGNSTGVCASSTSGSSPTAPPSATVAAGNGNGVSKPVAGVIGALVTLAVILGVEGLVMLTAGLRVVRKGALAGAAAAAAAAAEEAPPVVAQKS